MNTALPEDYPSISSASQSAQSSEIGFMHVPPGLNTRRLIDDFVRNYRSRLPKSVRKVRCSLCQDRAESDKPWKTKPTELIRHIMAHNGVRWYQCHISDCSQGAPQFTTKDQGRIHLEKYHGEPVSKLIELDLDLVF
ncbi:unnamed protein product [Rhizoctonia solani]|uniref:C2H2-type domain-containing protein n=1 Tax=Rhizoctonia solani TaxID=456999 RepID=A0A8H3HB21_9AGAM|nr:unnamed protein product [Rhizoctonia solani]